MPSQWIRFVSNALLPKTNQNNKHAQSNYAEWLLIAFGGG